MSKEQKNLRTISIIEIIAGLLFFVEGLIVASGKPAYFIAALITVITAVFCYMAATDASKAKPATILLWITIVINLLGIVLGLINKNGTVRDIALSAVDVCIAAYATKLIKEIH